MNPNVKKAIDLGKEKRHEEALKIFLVEAENKDPDALFYLSQYYFYGLGGIQADYIKSFALKVDAAELGQIDAMYDLALMYRKGIGTGIDNHKFFYWMNKAYEAGSHASINELGLAYSQGIGTSVNPRRALELFQEAAEKGSSMGLYNLGLFYYSGEHVAPDYRRALDYFLKAGDQGLAEGYLNAGNIYYEQMRDYRKAMDLYTKSAELGCGMAYRNLGLIFVQEQLVPPDYYKAYNYFSRGAELDDDVSHYYLAQCYLNGYGCVQNEELARQHLCRARDLGCHEAQEFLDESGW